MRTFKILNMTNAIQFRGITVSSIHDFFDQIVTNLTPEESDVRLFEIEWFPQSRVQSKNS